MSIFTWKSLDWQCNARVVTAYPSTAYAIGQVDLRSKYLQKITVRIKQYKSMALKITNDSVP